MSNGTESPTIKKRVAKWALRRVRKTAIKQIKKLGPWGWAAGTAADKLGGEKIDEAAAQALIEARERAELARERAREAKGRFQQRARAWRDRNLPQPEAPKAEALQQSGESNEPTEASAPSPATPPSTKPPSPPGPEI